MLFICSFHFPGMKFGEIEGIDVCFNCRFQVTFQRAGSNSLQTCQLRFQV